MADIFACDQKELKKIKEEDLKEFISKKSENLWINIDSYAKEDVSLLKDLFEIHPTTIEDIFSEQTTPKYEEFEEYKVTIFNGVKAVKKSSIETYNLSFITGKNFVITIDLSKEGTIKELLKNEKKIENLLRRGRGYIFHYILDKEVDKYLKIKSEASEGLKQIEKEFMGKPGKDVLTRMYTKENIFIDLRHLAESVTDLCFILTKPSENKVDNKLIPYFKDVYDHALKTAEGYETILKRIEGLEEWYATMTNLKTNEIIRYLTIITAIMMPLTILPGVYGMNVRLPFQDDPHAFLIICGMMAFFTGIMVLVSRRAGWISKKEKLVEISQDLS